MTRLDHLTVAAACTSALATLGAAVPPTSELSQPYHPTTDSYRLLSLLAEHALVLRAEIADYVPEDERTLPPTIAALTAELEEVRQQLAKVYTERAHVLAFLAVALDSAMSASDEQSPDLPVLMVSGPTGQMSWHIKGADLPLFAHVDKVLPSDPRTAWDGHSAEEKYERLRRLVALWAGLRRAVQDTA